MELWLGFGRLWRCGVVAGFDEGDEWFILGDRWPLVLLENRRILAKKKNLDQNLCQTKIKLETKNECRIWEEKIRTENENWKWQTFKKWTKFLSKLIWRETLQTSHKSLLLLFCEFWKFNCWISYFLYS